MNAFTPAPKPLGNAWVLAARPRTLPAAVAPVLLGTALAWSVGAFDLRVFLACLVGALGLQVGGNYANDLSDFVRGVDTPARVGPVRVTASGLLTPAQVRLGAAVAFGVATLAGLFLIVHAGWPILAIGVGALIAAVTYVGGPLPYGYRGLGELFVFLFFGLAAVVGTYFAHARGATAAVWAASGALGASASAVLVVNNIRDRVTDLAGGKRTLVAVYGRAFGDRFYTVLLAASVVCMAICAVLTGNILLAVVAAWAIFPTLKLIKRLRAADGPELNPLLGATATYGLRLALAASFALIVAKALGFHSFL